MATDHAVKTSRLLAGSHSVPRQFPHEIAHKAEAVRESYLPHDMAVLESARLPRAGQKAL